MTPCHPAILPSCHPAIGRHTGPHSRGRLRRPAQITGPAGRGERRSLWSARASAATVGRNRRSDGGDPRQQRSGDRPVRSPVRRPSSLGNACRGNQESFEEHPGRVALFPAVVEGGCAYWIRRGLNAMADNDDVEAVTRAINPGMLEYDRRQRNVQKAKNLLMEASSAEIHSALMRVKGSGATPR